MSQKKDKLSWRTRARLCWQILIKGSYDPKDYKTIHEEEQWEICEQRRKELAGSTRQRTEFGCDSEYMEQ